MAWLISGGLLLTRNVSRPGIGVSSIYPVLLELERCGLDLPLGC